MPESDHQFPIPWLVSTFGSLNYIKSNLEFNIDVERLLVRSSLRRPFCFFLEVSFLLLLRSIYLSP